MRSDIEVPGEGNEIPEVTEDFSEAFDEVARKTEAREESDHGAQEDQSSGRGDESQEFGEAFEDAAVTVAAAKGEADQEESLIEKVKRLEAVNAKLQQSERSQRGRVSALTKKLMDKKAATATEPPKDQGEGEGEGQDGDDEFDREFPEMAEILNKRVGKVLKKLEAVESKFEDVKSTTDILTEKEIIANKERQYDALATDFGHSDYQEILASPEWRQWKAAAPDDIQQKIKSHDAEDAAQVLDTFKESTGWKTPGRTVNRQTKSDVEIIKERREKALKRSAGIPTRKVGHRPQGEEDDGDFDAAFSARASKIEHDRATVR